MTSYRLKLIAAFFLMAFTLRGDIAFVAIDDRSSISNGLNVVEAFFAAMEKKDDAALGKILCLENGMSPDSGQIRAILRCREWFTCVRNDGGEKSRKMTMPHVLQSSQKRVSISMDEHSDVEICLIPHSLSVAFGHARMLRLVFPIYRDQVTGESKILIRGIRRNEEFLEGFIRQLEGKEAGDGQIPPAIK